MHLHMFTCVFQEEHAVLTKLSILQMKYSQFRAYYWV